MRPFRTDETSREPRNHHPLPAAAEKAPPSPEPAALERLRSVLGAALIVALLGFLAVPAAAQRKPKEATGSMTEKQEDRSLPEKEGAPEDLLDACDLDPLPALAYGTSDPYSGEPAAVRFALKFKDEVSPYRIMSTMVMPGEKMTIESVLSGRTASFTARSDGGKIRSLGKDKWEWTAPREAGNYCILITELDTRESVCLRAFVLTPYNGQDRLEGYRIGQYQSVPLRGNPVYNRPRGFIRVDKDDLDIWVSPHFQLRQFLCKQDSGWPKFLLLESRLLLKLEMLLAQFNDNGVKAESFFVMSGYRTPYYNTAIGNTTTYSRHGYGDAADIFIDNDRNGTMDDITGDGKVTMEDAQKLARILEGLTDDPWYRPFVGGLGLYGPKPHRGPFIHVDTRGFKARW